MKGCGAAATVSDGVGPLGTPPGTRPAVGDGVIVEILCARCVTFSRVRVLGGAASERCNGNAHARCRSVGPNGFHGAGAWSGTTRRCVTCQFV